MRKVDLLGLNVLKTKSILEHSIEGMYEGEMISYMLNYEKEYLKKVLSVMDKVTAGDLPEEAIVKDICENDRLDAFCSCMTEFAGYMLKTEEYGLRLTESGIIFDAIGSIYKYSELVKKQIDMDRYKGYLQFISRCMIMAVDAEILSLQGILKSYGWGCKNTFVGLCGLPFDGDLLSNSKGMGEVGYSLVSSFGTYMQNVLVKMDYSKNYSLSLYEKSFFLKGINALTFEKGGKEETLLMFTEDGEVEISAYPDPILTNELVSSLLNVVASLRSGFTDGLLMSVYFRAGYKPIRCRRLDEEGGYSILYM